MVLTCGEEAVSQGLREHIGEFFILQFWQQHLFEGAYCISGKFSKRATFAL
jgi:hypothetical protein